MVTLQAALQDSGAIDITLEENEEGDVDDDVGGDTVEAKDDIRHGVNCSNKPNDQGTQTELLSLFTMADVTVNESFEETHL